MRLREVERAARRVVPGSGAIRLSRLSAGPLHETFRVDRDGAAFSMQMAAHEGAPGPPAAQDGAWLLRVLRRAAEQALAPPLVYGDAQRRIIVQRWIEGRVWPGAAVGRPRNIERIAALLRRVHALGVPGRACTPAMWVRHYGGALAAQQRGGKRSRSGATADAARVLAAAAAARLRQLGALPAARAVVCHSDLHRLNLLEHRPSGGKVAALLLLDWEYAHVSEPFWDLAGWSANNDYGEPSQGRLLAAYLERAPRDAERLRLQLLGWLYDYVCWLWSELCLNARGGASHLASRAALLESRLITARI
jgi:thiamine kinase-like enzyme